METNNASKRFLVKHVGNMGDMVFFVPPILRGLKKQHPGCHITFVTAWGFKEKSGRWGKRNQGGFCVSLMLHSSNIDTLVHWHDTKTSLVGSLCIEDGVRVPTWSRAYYEKQKQHGNFDGVYELDIGIKQDENPMKRLFSLSGLPQDTSTEYRLEFTDAEKHVAQEVMRQYPYPRIVLLEGLEGRSTRGWDADKISSLEKEIEKTYGVMPIWFGAKYVREYQGRPLTLRENIATLSYCDVGIGVLSGPLHFAVAASLPVLSLICDQPLHRADPAYFLNPYIVDDAKKNRTLLGPSGATFGFLKEGATKISLTPQEWARQGYVDWNNPGRQATKSCLSVIAVDEVMEVLRDMVHNPSI